ncbi:MAG TPA: AraC family transcriptional regulator [Bacillus sp. (in: firmicutes)]|uniref:AraC family transcriptional regulator n=1 Tax=Bacillus litorisediminis TaxID=2922713 RepID=UPI001FAC5EFF|nr:AraC family transcriptional regulator [Bacillus litorisediminis]HWO77034.1 AraC family transcriptional regulator [Bacillus sp. (in: firmicutes)]
MTTSIFQIHEKVIKQFFQERLENQQNFYVHPSYNLEQQLLSAVQQGNYEEAKQVLTQINQLERAKLAENELRSLKNSLICTCTLFTRAIINGGVHPEIAFNLSDVYIREIERISNTEKLKSLEYEMLYSFVKTLVEEKQNSYSSLVNQVISFIHHHILHDLSLDQIARHVYVSPSYLSSKFKEEVGSSLSEYMNQKRIEESKYFLLHSRMSISEIAHLFRFCNQSYYTALFKKINGITPKKYRMTYINEALYTKTIG